MQMVKVIWEGSFARKARGDSVIVTEEEAELIAILATLNRKTVRQILLVEPTQVTTNINKPTD